MVGFVVRRCIAWWRDALESRSMSILEFRIRVREIHWTAQYVMLEQHQKNYGVLLPLVKDLIDEDPSL